MSASKLCIRLAFVVAVCGGFWHLAVANHQLLESTLPAEVASIVAAPDDLVGPNPFELPLDELMRRKIAPVAVCFDPDTPPEVIAYYNNLMLTGPDGMRYFLGGRWSGVQGSPRALTWSFVPDGLAVTGGNSELFSRLDTLFAAQGGRTTWINQFVSCFNRWAALTGTSYTRLTAPGVDWDDGAGWGSVGNGTTRGDIRISMTNIDGSSGTLAFNFFPSNGDMVLDRAENWGSSSNTWRFLRNVVMHEHGHGLGIAHVCSTNSGQLMEPFINTGFDGPQHDDIRAGQRHYGDPFENDNSAGAATNLGTITEGLPITLGPVPAPNVNNGSILSIDANSEVDFFRFTTTGSVAATVTVTPIGMVYDNSPQSCGADGSSCCTGNNIDSRALADLNVQIIAANGVTVIATGESSPAGSAEVLTNIPLLVVGNYYIRVYEGATLSQSQLYHLTLSVVEVDCNDNGLVDSCDVSCTPPCNVPGCGLSDDCNANGVPDECETDCNMNGVPDDCDISAATSEDCNNNIIPDECESQADCNGNTVQDICDVAAGTSLDCNENQVPDECDVQQPGADCNANLVPDDCELDTDGDEVIDECDGCPLDPMKTSPGICGCNVADVGDADLDGVLNCIDNCVNIPNSGQEDCDLDGVGDVCAIDSGEMIYQNASVPNGFIQTTAPIAQDLHFQMPQEVIGYDINFVSGGSDAAALTVRIYANNADNSQLPPDGLLFARSHSITLGSPTLLQEEISPPLAVPQDIWLELQFNSPNYGWTRALGGPAIGTTSGTYYDSSSQSTGTAWFRAVVHADVDCNGNAIPDGCDIEDETSPDCNENGLPDECDIARGISADANGNNVPDECDSGGIPGDLDGDGDVDLIDFSTLSVCFGGPGVFSPPPGCSGAEFDVADLDGDGDVDLGDFSSFATNFTGPQ